MSDEIISWSAPTPGIYKISSPALAEYTIIVGGKELKVLLHAGAWIMGPIEYVVAKKYVQAEVKKDEVKI